jgi:hypothetical protein
MEEVRTRLEIEDELLLRRSRLDVGRSDARSGRVVTLEQMNVVRYADILVIERDTAWLTAP